MSLAELSAPQVDVLEMLRSDLAYFAANNLKIRGKSGEILPFVSTARSKPSTSRSSSSAARPGASARSW